MVHSHCVNAQAGLWFGIWDLRLGVTFQNRDIHFVHGIVWAAEQQHLPHEHWGLLLFALKDLYDWTLHQNKSFNLHFLSMSAFFGVSCVWRHSAFHDVTFQNTDVCNSSYCVGLLGSFTHYKSPCGWWQSFMNSVDVQRKRCCSVTSWGCVTDFTITSTNVWNSFCCWVLRLLP